MSFEYRTLPPDLVPRWWGSSRIVVSLDSAQYHGGNRSTEGHSRSASVSVLRPHWRDRHRRLDSHHARTLGNGRPRTFTANYGSPSMSVLTNISTYQRKFLRSIGFETESSPLATINVASTIKSWKALSKASSKENCRMPTLSWRIQARAPSMSPRSLLRQKVSTLMDRRLYFVRINAQVLTQITVQFGKQHGLRARRHCSSSLSRSKPLRRGVRMWMADWLITILGSWRCQRHRGFGVL